MAFDRRLLVFLLLTVGGGLAIGLFALPGDWYARLAKPSFNPPNWLFGPVWTILYVMIAIAGWRIWRVAPRSAAMKFWAAQLALNFCWSPMFFIGHNVGAAMAIIVAIWVAIVGFMVRARRHDGIAAGLFAPYLLWVSFASALNGAILALNGARPSDIDGTRF